VLVDDVHDQCPLPHLGGGDHGVDGVHSTARMRQQ
jgi:hypothetical protein